MSNVISKQKLSPIQKEAVNWEGKPLLILAGPGSGKTRVLTCKIAKILESHENQNFHILGLTFTNKAANEMSNRLENIMVNQRDRVFLGTFHSFCASILRQHGSHLGIKSNFEIYSQDKDLKLVLRSILNEEDLKLGINLNTLLLTIKYLQERLILPEDSKNIFKDIKRGKLISKVYSLYERKMKEKNALDFNSLILNTYKLFNNFPIFAEQYQEIYSYICVDEFQDTNYAQYEILKILIGEHNKNNAFLVADDDQIIYQWNGANPQRIKSFIDDYNPKIIQLPLNYRCPPDIVELANNLIVHNFIRTQNKKPLESVKKNHGTAVTLLNFNSLKDEANGIAEDIKEKHYDNLESTVIIGRTRRLLKIFKFYLEKKGLSAVISQRKEDFESTPLIWIHSILKLANDKKNEASLEAVCGSFCQITGIKINSEDVIKESQASEIGYLQHWITLALKSDLTSDQKELIVKTREYMGKGKDFEKFSKFALNWFEKIVKQKQENISDPTNELFNNFEEEKEVWENLMNEIIQILGEEISLEAFLQELQMHSKEPLPNPDTVVLMTIHGAKGKEFNHVYLVGLVEDELPSFQSKKEGDQSSEMEEERRNCFVAITRTKISLTLSYAHNYRGWAKKPSRFLSEMGLL